MGKCENVRGLRKSWIEKTALLISPSAVFKDGTIGRIADEILKIQGEEDHALSSLRAQLSACEKGYQTL